MPSKRPARSATATLSSQVRQLQAQLDALRAESGLIQGDFRQVIDASPVPLSVDDMQGSIIYINRKFREKFGYSREEVPTSATWFQKAYPDPAYRAIVSRQWKNMFGVKVRSGKEIGPLEVDITCKDGSKRTVEIVGRLLGNWLLLAFNDVTERERLEKQILEISQQEQERIGQDLHDGVCQLLSGIKFKTTLLEQKLQSSGAPEARDASELEAYLNEAIQQARNLAKGLHPVDLEARGLRSALEGLAHSSNVLYGVKCTCQFRGAALVHDHAKATHFFRIAQEALNNAVRHGKATRLVLRLSTTPQRVTMEVEDNGLGFSGRTRKRTGMGLHLMNYRARAVGGSLVIRRAGLRGTLVSCTAPLNRNRFEPSPNATKQKR